MLEGNFIYCRGNFLFGHGFDLPIYRTRIRHNETRGQDCIFSSLRNLPTILQICGVESSQNYQRIKKNGVSLRAYPYAGPTGLPGSATKKDKCQIVLNKFQF